MSSMKGSEDLQRPAVYCIDAWHIDGFCVFAHLTTNAIAFSTVDREFVIPLVRMLLNKRRMLRIWCILDFACRSVVALPYFISCYFFVPIFLCYFLFCNGVWPLFNKRLLTYLLTYVCYKMLVGKPKSRTQFFGERSKRNCKSNKLLAYKTVALYVCSDGYCDYRVATIPHYWHTIVRSKSSKVNDFNVIWKPVFDFLLVINSNLGPILHRLVTTHPLQKTTDDDGRQPCKTPTALL